MPAKYITDQFGVLKLNPEFQKTSTVAHPEKALAIISTQDDAMATQRPLAASTSNTIQIMQSDAFIDDFNLTPDKKAQIQSGDIFEGITKYFERYETPLGLLNGLVNLNGRPMEFGIDDSSSTI